MIHGKSLLSKVPSQRSVNIYCPNNHYHPDRFAYFTVLLKRFTGMSFSGRQSGKVAEAQDFFGVQNHILKSFPLSGIGIHNTTQPCLGQHPGNVP